MNLSEEHLINMLIKYLTGSGFPGFHNYYSLCKGLKPHIANWFCLKLQLYIHSRVSAVLWFYFICAGLGLLSGVLRAQFVGLSTGVDCLFGYRTVFTRAKNQKYKKWGDCKAAVFCEEKKNGLLRFLRKLRYCSFHVQYAHVFSNFCSLLSSGCLQTAVVECYTTKFQSITFMWLKTATKCCSQQWNFAVKDEAGTGTDYCYSTYRGKQEIADG